MKSKMAIYNPNTHKYCLVKLGEGEIPFITDRIQLNDIYGVIFTPTEYYLNTKGRKLDVIQRKANDNSTLFTTIFTVRIGRIAYLIKTDIYNEIDGVKEAIEWYKENTEEILKIIEREANFAFSYDTVEY